VKSIYVWRFTTAVIIKQPLINPVRHFHDVRRQVSKDLTNYASFISNLGSADPERMDEAASELRERATELGAARDDLIFHTLVASFNLAPSDTEINNACDNLIGLSNSVHNGEPLRNHNMKMEVETSPNLN